MKIVIPEPARELARINSGSDVSRAIFRQTTISPCAARVTYTPNESRPGPGWSVSNRTREFRTRAIEYFAGGGHVLSTISHATLSANHLPLIASFFAPKIINYQWIFIRLSIKLIPSAFSKFNEPSSVRFETLYSIANYSKCHNWTSLETKIGTVTVGKWFGEGREWYTERQLGIGSSREFSFQKTASGHGDRQPARWKIWSESEILRAFHSARLGHSPYSSTLHFIFRQEGVRFYTYPRIYIYIYIYSNMYRVVSAILDTKRFGNKSETENSVDLQD